MKRVIILCITLAAMTAIGNAQIFVEGSVEAEYNDATAIFFGYKPEKGFAYSYFSVSPLVGYQLNDNFAVGAKATFSRKTEWGFYPDWYTGDQENWGKIITRWNSAVFCRYKIWGMGKLSLLVESSAGIGGASTEEKTGSVLKKITTSTSFSIDASPLITYDISNKWSLTTTYSLFNLGFNHVTAKNEETGLTNKYYSYGFGAGSSLPNPLGLVIGFIYHFQ